MAEFLFILFLQLTGSESVMDLWILSRLSAAVEACNKGFENYELSAATSACYNLWLYDLCDVYLVSELMFSCDYVIGNYM